MKVSVSRLAHFFTLSIAAIGSFFMVAHQESHLVSTAEAASVDAMCTPASSEEKVLFVGCGGFF